MVAPPIDRSHRKRLPCLPWAATTLVILAFALRVYQLGAQSLWYDEGMSVALAGRSLATIARNAANDIHPPLYYWLLAMWLPFAGNSEFAVRWPSVAAGTALVAGLVVLGRRLWTPKVGYLAAGLATISPYLIWYSQEARMYMLAAALGMAVLILMLGLLAAPGTGSRSGGRWWLLLALLTGLLYTHYLGAATVLLAANLMVAVHLFRGKLAFCPERPQRKDHRAWLARWLAVQFVALALFLPWLRLAWPALADWPPTSPPFTLWYALREALATFALGARHPPWLPWAELIWAVPIVVALAYGWRSRRLRASVLVFIWASAAPLGLWMVGRLRPAWDSKHLIVSAPGFELLLAAGLAQLVWLARRWFCDGTAGGRPACEQGARPAMSGRRAAVFAALPLLLVFAGSRSRALSAMWHDPAQRRDDYRAIARTIAELAGPEDAVILNAPTQIEIFEYYDKRAHVTYPLPRSRPPDPEATEQELQAIAAQHRDLHAVLWATQQSDPQGTVEGWLNHHRYKTTDQWFGNVRLALWAAAREPMRELRLLTKPRFGDELALIGIAHSPLVAKSGDILTLELWWQPIRPPRADYTVFCQLLDSSGRVAAQRDMRPVGGTARTSQWEPTEEASSLLAAPRQLGSALPGPANLQGVVVDRLGLLLPKGLAPKAYRWILGLYDATSGERLTVQPAWVRPPGLPDALEIGMVVVE